MTRDEFWTMLADLTEHWGRTSIFRETTVRADEIAAMLRDLADDERALYAADEQRPANDEAV